MKIAYLLIAIGALIGWIALWIEMRDILFYHLPAGWRRIAFPATFFLAFGVPFIIAGLIILFV